MRRRIDVINAFSPRFETRSLPTPYAYGVGNDLVSKRGENALITSMRLRMVGEVFEELSAVATLPVAGCDDFAGGCHGLASILLIS